MIAERHALRGRAAAPSTRPCWCRRRRHAGHVPHARHRRRQGPALHAGQSRRRTRRSAGGPSASASTGPACCAPRCAPCSRPPAGARSSIMFPMVADRATSSLRAKAIVEREMRPSRRATATRCRPIVKLGVMIEVPSLLFQLDEIAAGGRFPLGRLQRPDAVPVRRRPREPPVANRFDPLSARVPARAASRRRDRPARPASRSRCAARSAEARSRPWRCIGLGFRSLSMSPASIGPVKAMLLALEAATRRRAHPRGAASDGQRHAPAAACAFAEEHGMPV